MATKAKPKTHSQRASLPRNYWHRKVESLHFGDQQFRVIATPAGGGARKSLDDFVESITWDEPDDQSAVLTGSLGLRRPEANRRFEVNISDVVECQVARLGQNNWRSLWRMRLEEPEYQLAQASYTYHLSDDLTRLRESTDDFRFRADRAHPHGWLGHEIIAFIARKYGFKVTRLPKMRHRIKKLSMTNVTPLSVIGRVLRYERVAKGTRYFMRWEKGGLALVPFQRSKELLVMTGTIIDGTLTRTKDDKFATVVEVHATRTTVAKTTDAQNHKRHTKKKVGPVTQRNTRAIKKYGYIKRTIHAPDHADSEAELRSYGKRYLARHSQPKRELTFTHPGITSLRRGAALRLTIPEAGISQQVVFVAGVTHNVTPGNYTMDVTVRFDDPYPDIKKKSAAAKRCDTARARNRPEPRGCPHGAHPKPQPSYADQRRGAARGGHG